MADEQPNSNIDVTQAWQASQDQKGKAKSLRIYAALCWLVAIGTEVAAIVMLKQGKFQSGNLVMAIGLIVVIAAFAIGGNLMWKASNKHDPASRSEPFRFFVQNQLGAIITLIAFLPLIVLILLDKNMDPKNKKILAGVAAALGVAAFASGVETNPNSVEDYTKQMNTCAEQIKAKQPTTACSPEVAQQAQDIARDTEAVAEATKSDANPNGLDTVYWIAPKDGKKKSDSQLVFHLCEGVSDLRGKVVNKGTVTEAYSQNAVRITKEIKSEQKQCGFGVSAAAPAASAAPAAAQ